MIFGNLSYLSLIWVVPLLVVFYIYAFRARRRILERFCLNDKLLGELIPEVSYARKKFKAFLIVVVVALSIFTLIRPKWGFHWEDVHRYGVDIIVALDVSQSMMAEDVEPNRLERAKREIKDLIRLLQGDRIGLIAFAGVSFVQCPLTLDYGATRMFLENISTDLIPVPGTSIGSAVELAMKSFKTKEKNSKALILITDGEDHSADPLAVAKEAKKEGIRIFTIGVGKEGGAPIPENGEQGGFKKDSDGNMILTKLDETTLQKLALETSGSYVRSVSGDMDLEKIYLEDIKQRMEQQELTSTRQKKWEERFQIFLAFALMVLIFEMLLPERKRRIVG